MGMWPGDDVAIRFTKWGGGRHWEMKGRYVCADRHGTWVYGPPGTRMQRPGHEFRAPFDFLSLFPGGAAWAATFYDWPGHDTSIYIDVSTVPVWPGPGTVTMVDLDLDVILLMDGNLFIDDENDFEEHQAVLEYPPEIVALARASADWVLAAIGDGVEPFLSMGHEHLRSARAASDLL